MERRRLGRGTLELTTVGLGTWAIGGPWDWGWGPQDDRASISTIHRALDLGVNWIDTAPCYGVGHSEEVVGRTIRGRSDRPMIATKCGLVWDEPADGSVFARLTGRSVRAEAEASLRRLGVDVIDLYQVHWPNPDSEIEEAWEVIARLVDEGKVRYAGVSNFSVSQIRRAQTIHPVTSLQPPYSMLRRQIEDELLPFCLEEGIGVIPYSPMQAGLLTGRFTQDRLDGLPVDDWRRKNEHFREPLFSAHLQLVEALRPIAEAADRTLAELAIAWTLRRPEVTAAIVGARRPEQLDHTVSASGWQLTPTEIAKIEALLSAHAGSLPVS